MTASSGTYDFNPAASDMVLEAFSRCGIRAGALNAQHMFDARMSCQLLLSQWSVRVPNLWLVTLQQINLTQGVATYVVPTNTVTVLDAYIRQFDVGNGVNVAVNMSTVANSTTATIYWPNSNVYASEWINVTIPVAIGGIVIQGFYQVASVIDANNFTITLTSPAKTTVNNGGVLPQFTSQLGSATVYVSLPNHGYVVGQYFTVQIPTTVGGLALSGAYQVQNVVNSTVFAFSAVGLANANAIVYENGGQQSYQTQVQNSQPFDRVITPISRTDYADQPDKATQAYPTTYWYDRQINPLVTLWPVPDQNGPYVLNLYTVTQPQDAVLNGGTGLNIPYRFFEAFAAGLARRLARKYAPALAAELLVEEQMAWSEAADEDIEGVALMLRPGMDSYFR